VFLVIINFISETNIATITVTPSADNGAQQLDYVGSSSHYANVDEVVADDTDYNVAPPDTADWVYDLYDTTADGTVPAGSTNISVTVYFRIHKEQTGGSSGTTYIRPRIAALAQAVFNGSGIACTATPTLRNQVFAVNPVTTNAWTVDEVNDLDLGCSGIANTYNWDAECTQLYAVITYTEGATTRTDRFFQMF
jgi:hypothetical protein